MTSPRASHGSALRGQRRGVGRSVTRSAVLPSILDTPRNRADMPDADPSTWVAPADLAAACAWGIIRSHPFVDGNKRVALILCETFLVINGYELDADDVSLTMAFVELAAGTMDEATLAKWLRSRIRRI